MNRLVKKRKFTGILNSKLFLIILIIIIIFLSNSAYNIYKRYSDTKDYLSILEQEYANLETRYDEASGDLEYFNSKTGKEKEIRIKYDLSLEGEKAVLIIDEEILEQPTVESKTFVDKIKDFISF